MKYRNDSTLFTLDLSGWDTSNVQYMNSMFNNCRMLKTIYVSDKWSTESLINPNNKMFTGCTSLVGGAGTTYDANYTTATRAHIDGGTLDPGYLTASSEYNPTAIIYSDGTMVFQRTATADTSHGTVVASYPGIGGWLHEGYSYDQKAPWYSNSGAVTSVIVEADIQPTSTVYWFMNFDYCKSFDLRNLKTYRVYYMNSMFQESGNSSVILGIEDGDVSEVMSMSTMFGRYNGTIGDLSNWAVGYVEDMSCMFNDAGGQDCEIDLGDISGWDVSCVEDMSFMFYDAYFEDGYYLDLSGWDISSISEYDGFNDGVANHINPPVFE